MRRIQTIFQNMRFKQKLFVSYVIVSFIPILVLGIFAYSQASSLLLLQAEQNLDGAVGRAAETINSRAKQHEAIIISVTQNMIFKQIFIENNGDFPVLYRDYVDPFFSNILDFNKDILQISVFTENQQILRGEYILPIGLTADLPWAAGKKLQSGSQGTEWHIRNNKMFATRAFIGEDGPKLGSEPAVLFLSIDTDSMLQELDGLKKEAYGVLLLDREGSPIYSRRGGEGNQALLMGDIDPASLTNPNGSITMNGTSYMYIDKEIPETGWRLVYFTPKSAITFDASSIMRATALTAFICLIILSLIIAMFSGTFVKRIIKLNKQMLVVENGNLKIDVSSPSKDEIGQLTNRFGNMLNNINTLIEEVYQSKITQREAELKALQTQINPHFLYNTLSIINWKALEIDAMEISQITNTVSRFYRTVLNKGRSFIPVLNEINNAKDYMQIQLIMHNNSFDFICEVDESLYRYDTINLIFQPILENALEHGIDQLRKGSRRGRIVLKGYLAGEGEDLEFAISDNGPGMSREVANEVLVRSFKGYGLKNVHDRIQIRFGPSYGLRIESEQGSGTTIYIRFPKYMAAPGEESQPPSSAASL